MDEDRIEGAAKQVKGAVKEAVGKVVGGVKLQADFRCSCYRERGIGLYFRADAAFAKPEIYETLEAEGVRYAIRLPANRVLQDRIAHLLTRPVGRPPRNRRCSTPASRTGRRAGASRAGWWPRSSGTRASCTRG